MSKQIASVTPSVSQMAMEPTTPPAGPDSIIWIHCWRAEAAHDLARRALVERRLLGAVGEHALRHLKDQIPRNKRSVLAEKQVEGFGPIDAADLVNVPKAPGRNQRRSGALSLEDRVDDYG